LTQGKSLHELPDDLPAPTDDGACDHLRGSRVPHVALPSTGGHSVRLAESPGRTVVFAYPRTGRPGVEMPAGWNLIPGAMGCTPEACGFRDLHGEFARLGTRVLGLSTQTTEYQQEMVDRLGIPFEVLSDAELELTEALRLPTLEVEGETLIRRLTLVISGGVVEHVFYPVFPPDGHADEVLNWLRSERPRG
jgi:peroxiredoxin